MNGDPRARGEHPALRAYAVVLSLLHALTGAAWLSYKNVASLVTGEDAVCWPLAPGCVGVRAHLTEGLVRGAVIVLMALGVGAAALFAARKERAATMAFALAALLGTAVYALDYRMRMNQTYMFGAVALVFLLLPKSGRPAGATARALQALLALFYFWAGTLKVDREWISGAALYAKPLFVPAALVPASCVYVLVLELALIWGLFAARPGWRWAVYAQLVVFHVVSFGVVGWFYPLLMLGLTAIYPLVWRLAPADALTFASLRDDAGTRRLVISLAAAFSALQLVPYLFPGDTAVTGEGRLFALHMFDARAECAGGATLRGRDGTPRARAELINRGLDYRTRCDPIVLAAAASRLCALVTTRPDVGRVDVAIDAKRTSDTLMRPLIHVDDWCARMPKYSAWTHNAWIEAN